MRELPSPGQRHRVSTRRRVMSERAPQGATVVRPASSLRDSAVHRKQCEAAGSRALLKLAEERCPDDLFAETHGRRRSRAAAALAASDRVRRRASSQLDTRPSRLHRQAACTYSLATQTLNEPSTGRNTGHHDADCSARLDPVKALRFAPTPCGAHGLDRLSVEPREGTYVMAGRQEEGSTTDKSHARHLTHIQHRYDDRRTTWSKTTTG
jgi:hypothetical protein